MSTPPTLDTTAAVQAVADDYIEQRTIGSAAIDTGRDGLRELVDEAIAHATSILSVQLDEDAHDTISEELTDRYTVVDDDTRANGPRL